MKRILSILLLCASPMLFAHTHAFFQEVEADGSTTFYCETYQSSLHPSWDGVTPTGGLTVDGTVYSFTSVVSSLPSGATLIKRTGPLRSTTKYQVVNVKKCAGTYTLSTTSEPDLVPNPRSGGTFSYSFGYTISATASADASVVYFGYAPQECANLTASAVGGVAPYTYSWTTGDVTPGATVCPIANSVYTVTITDVNGCSATASVSVDVVDVHCGKKGNKVLVCHNGKSICIANSAVAAHLANHGDALGGCANKTDVTNVEEVNVYPNPSNGEMHLEYNLFEETTVRIEVLDLSGRMVYSESFRENEGVYMNELNLNSFAPGMYILNFHTNDIVETHKIYLN